MTVSEPLQDPAGGRLDAVWEAAKRACERSVLLRERHRRALERQRAAIEILRSTLPTDGAPAIRVPAGNGVPRYVAPLDPEDETVVGTLTLLPVRRAIGGPDGRVALTSAEWQLLAALLAHRGEILTRPELAGRAWGPAFAGRHGEVEVYVSRLRRKLERAGRPARIETVRGRGYRLVMDD